MNSRLLLALAFAAAGPLAGCGGGYDTAQAMYCYKTLANVDCYTQPVAQDYRRLVGYVGEPPPRPAPQPLTVLPAPPPRQEIADLWDGDQISR